MLHQSALLGKSWSRDAISICCRAVRNIYNICYPRTKSPRSQINSNYCCSGLNHAVRDIYNIC
jgi:hypothetical protein